MIRSWRPSLSKSAKMAQAVFSRSPTPEDAVMSSKVPSPRLRYSRLGRPGRLADVEIVEAVAVDIADRNAIVAVDVDAAGSVENGAPIVNAT